MKRLKRQGKPCPKWHLVVEFITWTMLFAVLVWAMTLEPIY